MSEGHDKHEAEQKSHGMKHMVLMMLCCLAPMIAVVVVAALFPGASYLNFLFILICPISMALMMLPNWLSKKKQKSSCH